MERTEAKPRPNVLWVMSDQHHAECMGNAGHPTVRTPHLDALAAEGFCFNRAYCNNPICGPSRCTLMTGQHPHTHGITGNAILGFDRSNPETAPAHFRKHGYQTAMVGKGHLPMLWMRAAFEHLRFSDCCDALPDDPRTSDYFRYLVEQGLGDQYDLGALPPGHPGQGMQAFTSGIPREHSLETWTGNEALAFLDGRDTERPFFLKVSFQRPHDPFAPSPESVGLYPPESVVLPENASDFFETRFAGKPRLQQEYVTGEKGYPYRPLDKADLQRQMAHYFALITEIDTQIGRVCQRLKDSGEWENTIVVYLADHGDFAGEHGLCLKNLGIYEPIHRVPFIWKWPGGPQGKTEAMVELVDLAPSLVAAAGLPPMESAEGRDVRPVAEGREEGLSATICEWDATAHEQGTVFAVRSERYRLVFHLNAPDDGEIYDHQQDSGELVNLWREPAQLSIREHLTRTILRHVGQFRRLHSAEDDKKVERNDATWLLQSKGKRWTEVREVFGLV